MSELPAFLQMGRLFEDAATPHEGERFDTLLNQRNLVIERIVGSATLEPTEYVQAQDEWVLLLRGEATLEVAGRQFELRAGDYLFLPAGTHHVVRRATDGALWLAVHLH